MTPSEYTQLALKTEKTPLYINAPGGVPSHSLSRIDHAIKGLVTEAGELEDVLKKQFIYGKAIDRVNLVEEAGDILWYLALLLRTLESSFEEAMEKNVAKLKKRFPEGFSEERALNRDLVEERKVLEDDEATPVVPLKTGQELFAPFLTPKKVNEAADKIGIYNKPATDLQECPHGEQYAHECGYCLKEYAKACPALPSIIGLAGKARSGKNTMADYLTKKYGYIQVSFAGALKNATRAIFGFSEEQVNGSLKEVMDPLWGFTPRYALQKLGTEGVRNIFGADTWVRALKVSIKQDLAAAMQNEAEPILRFVVTDVRFPNEADAIKDWGGKVWRLTRLDFGGDLPSKAAAHPSETALDSYEKWDAVIAVASGHVPGLYDGAEKALNGETYVVERRP